MAALLRGAAPRARARLARAHAAAPAAGGQAAAGAAAPPPQPQGRPLLIVESPAKAAKIESFLGGAYAVAASYGHVADLPPRAGSVRPDAGFELAWEAPPRARPRLAALAAAARAAGGRVLLGTDPDREGEAIAWHLARELAAARALPRGGAPPARVAFAEVTEPAVRAALAAPRPVSQPLVDAYFARRALDYLYGFGLSPLLWRKLPGAKSAGRVQSVALRLLCEREAEVEAFRARPYWTVGARLDLGGGAPPLPAALARLDGAPPPAPGFGAEAEAAAAAARVRAASPLAVRSAGAAESARRAPPPLTTSAMQQEASRRLGMGAARCMAAAQALYEAGLVTYIRTDGAAVSPAAAAALRAAAGRLFGAEFMHPGGPAAHAGRRRPNAQEAHEAIRPTDPMLAPTALAAAPPAGVDAAAARLYALIWARAVGSQMAPARVARARAEFEGDAGAVVLRATASCVVFPGFLDAWRAAGLGDAAPDAAAPEDGAPEGGGEEGGEGAPAARPPRDAAARRAAVAALSGLAAGARARVAACAADAHETRPPPRYTDGSLVAALEAAGVGRPSTWAPIIKTLAARGYAGRAEGRGRALVPTPLGRVLSAFLGWRFPAYVDAGFTAEMEAALDEVSAGRGEWRAVLGAFWGPFKAAVDGSAGVGGEEVVDRLNADLAGLLFGAGAGAGGGGAGAGAPPPGRRCPRCGGQLSVKLSYKGGPFVGCAGFRRAEAPCTYARAIGAAEAAAAAGAEDGGADAAAAAAERARHGLAGAARSLGPDPGGSGMEVFLRVGRYGPYLQVGQDGEAGGRRVALPRAAAGPRASLADAAVAAALALPRALGPHPETGEQMAVRAGPFGPFVEAAGSGLRRAVPKGEDPLALSAERAVELLAAAAATAAKRAAKAGAAGAAVERAPAKPRRAAAAGKKRTTAKAKKAPARAALPAPTAPAAAASPAKRSKSAYSFYLAQRTPALRDLALGARSAAVAAEWRGLAPEARAPFEALAAAARREAAEGGGA